MTTNFVRLTATAALLTCLTAGTALAQGGQTFDKHTAFTFSGPVAIPGVTLPAGKYVFRVLDMQTRSVIQVLSGDGSKQYAVLFYVRAERMQAASTPEVRFMETPAGVTRAIKTMWYPGDRAGWEFVYPKAQARALAEATGQPVLTTEEETPVATAAPALRRVAPSGAETAATPTPPAAPEGPVLQGEVAEPQLQARAELPKTAGATWTTAAVGVLFLLGAAAIRRRRNRLA